MNRAFSRVRFINSPDFDISGGDFSGAGSSCVRSSSERKGKICHRAGWVLVNPFQVIENGCVEVENDLITGVYNASCLKNPGACNVIDHGPGVIMPALINAHLHLELSALKNSLCFDKGFAAWVRELLEKREALGETILAREAQKAAANLNSQGTGYIGEISTLGFTKKIVQSLNLSGIWFQEFLGSGPFETEPVETKKKSLSFSLAGHAPHTTNPFLLQAAKKQTRDRGLPFSIHLAESDEESKFISGEEGEWGKFLASRGIDTSSWPIGSKSPVQYLDDLGVLDSATLGVHLLNVGNSDLDILAKTRTNICLCPRSNWNLHKKLPDIGKMLKKNLAPALGSDSLASCDSLDIFDEMRFVREKYPNIDPNLILSMATINGARALGLESFAGTLDKGKKPAFIYVDLNVHNKSALIERLTTN